MVFASLSKSEIGPEKRLKALAKLRASKAAEVEGDGGSSRRNEHEC